MATLKKDIMQRKPKQIPHIYSVRLRNFIELMLSKRESQRPTAEEALS